MKHGLFMFPTHDAIDPGSLARLAEDAGFESLFFPDHTHIPASRLSPFPGGGELGREYFHNLDVFVAMAALNALEALGARATTVADAIQMLPSKGKVPDARYAPYVSRLLQDLRAGLK